MPLYEYRCDDCGHRFEKIVKFSDPPLEVCPSCGGKVQKLMSSPAIQFKGSGWYITDYAKKSGSDASKGKSGGETSDKPSTGTSTESASSTTPAPAASTSSTSKD